MCLSAGLVRGVLIDEKVALGPETVANGRTLAHQDGGQGTKTITVYIPQVPKTQKIFLSHVYMFCASMPHVAMFCQSAIQKSMVTLTQGKYTDRPGRVNVMTLASYFM